MKDFIKKNFRDIIILLGILIVFTTITVYSFQCSVYLGAVALGIFLIIMGLVIRQD